MTELRKTKPILRVLSGEALQTRPIWLMRQAGRYLPEYRQLRAEAGDFMKLCFTPKLAAEVTLQPIRRFGFDGAILFSDILVIPHGLGQKLWFAEGEGPKLAKLQPGDFAKLDPSGLMTALSPIMETIDRVKPELPPSVTMLGFAGAPWTVANYMIAGGSSDDSEDLRRFSYRHPSELDALINLLVDATITYLVGQVRAGAEALQLFESWGGTIPSGVVQKYSIDPIARIIAGVRSQCPDTPFIVFPRASGSHYAHYARTGANALSVDFQTSLTGLRMQLPSGMGLQGNLDPMLLATGGTVLDESIEAILRDTQGTPHIFNLGHGIRQETPVAHVQQMIDRVRSAS